MARRLTTGWGTQHWHSDGCNAAPTGAMTYSTNNLRPGPFTRRCNPASGAAAYQTYAISGAAGTTEWMCTDVLVATRNTGANLTLMTCTHAGIEMTTSGTLQINSSLGVSGTSTTALALNTWYRLEWRVLINTGSTDQMELRIYLADDTTPLETVGPFTGLALTDTAITRCVIGADSTGHTNSPDVYFANLRHNDSTGAAQNSWPGPGKVYTLRPNGAGTAGTSEGNWTKPGGATTNKNTSVDNTPTVYGADSTSSGVAENFLRNATAASSDTTHTLPSYQAAGVSDQDAIKVIAPVAVLGSSSTSAKTGTLGMPSNPTIAQTNVAYPTSVASSTATTWGYRTGTVTYDPTPTRGTQPEIRLNRPATSAGTAMTNALAVLVDAQPPAATGRAPVGARGVWQAVNRASTY